MKRLPNIEEEARLLERSARCEPIRSEAHEVRYLDLSGDGVPDAVEHITRSATCSRGSERVDTVQETRRLEYGIGIDGRPTGVAERTVVSELDSDDAPAGGRRAQDRLVRTA